MHGAVRLFDSSGYGLGTAIYVRGNFQAAALSLYHGLLHIDGDMYVRRRHAHKSVQEIPPEAQPYCNEGVRGVVTCISDQGHHALESALRLLRRRGRLATGDCS